MGDLFGGDGDDVKFKINEDYAKKYPKWRSKEFSEHWKNASHKNNIKHSLDHDDESTSEDDEDAKDIEHYEKGFFQTMAWLKSEDPSKYDNDNKKFFPDPSTFPKSRKNPEEKPFVLRDYERNLIVKKKGKLSDDEEIPEEDPRSSSPTYVEEQKALKDTFKQAIEDSDAEGDKDNIGKLFKKKKKSKAEIQKEEEDYREWLKGRKKELKDKNTASELKNLHDYWTDPNLSSEEVFLRDYILNHKFLDPEDEEYQPAHNEIVHDSCDLDVDMKHVNRMDKFEMKYNFRFEDPDQEFIKRYPRCMESSLRVKDDRRKQKRQEVKERKEAEKEAKREEIKQLKAIKRKEILAKIEKIKQITGNDDVNFEDDDFEDDFNPEKHDQKMRELFNDDYYQQEEEEKPVCPELERELEIENWEKWRGKDAQDEQYNGYSGEDAWVQPESEAPDFNMDCDYDPKAQLQDELISMTKSKKKQRRKSKFAAALAKEKPVFDPNAKKFEQYFDEYYKLDCEDIIGDLPCRFKYRQTTPNDYGLTVDEILRADDKELNKWCSLKKVVKYKPEHVEKYEVQDYEKRAKNEALKRKILPSLYVSTPDNMHQNGIENCEMRGGKKKMRRKENIEVLNAEPERNEFEDAVEVSSEGTKKQKATKRKLQENEDLNEEPEKEQNFSNIMINGSPENFLKQEKKKGIKNKKLIKKKSINEVEYDTSEKYQVSVVKKAKLNNQTKKKKSKLEQPDSNIPISDDRLKAYGIHPKKFKNKIKYGNNQINWK